MRTHVLTVSDNPAIWLPDSLAWPNPSQKNTLVLSLHKCFLVWKKIYHSLRVILHIKQSSNLMGCNYVWPCSSKKESPRVFISNKFICAQKIINSPITSGEIILQSDSLKIKLTLKGSFSFVLSLDLYLYVCKKPKRSLFLLLS